MSRKWRTVRVKSFEGKLVYNQRDSEHGTRISVVDEHDRTFWCIVPDELIEELDG